MKLARLFGDSTVDVCEDTLRVRDFATSKLNSVGREEKDDAFHVCDLGDVVKKWRRWNEVLPQVQPFYAVKCNPDKLVLRQLDNLGVNYDCASKGEMKTILEMGVQPERIVFANPCKQISHIKYARSCNVTMMTFDNEAELHKVKHHHPNAELIIRIKVDDSKSLCKFGIKFGVDPCDAKGLLKCAWDLGLNVIGVSFHVGSGCYDASLFYEAVKSAKTVFDQGAEIGYSFKLLDIGGGFPGHDLAEISFEDTVRNLTRGFAEFFPPSSGVKIIAEPGRYFVASAYTTVCNITSVREVTSSKPNVTSSDKLTSSDAVKEVEGYMYYLNDGVYGSFNCILFDHQYPAPYALKGPGEEEPGARLYECSVWGPTCDSLDCISKSAKLPKLSIGDWIVFDNMGAYTTAAASQFNGFKKPNIHYMIHKSNVEVAENNNNNNSNNNNNNNNSNVNNNNSADSLHHASCKSSAKIPRTASLPVTSVC